MEGQHPVGTKFMNKVVTSSINYRVGQNIARIRKQETGYTQSEMEEYSGISRAYYGRIELGLHSPTMDTLINIANKINVQLTQLFLDENNNPV